MKPIYSPFNPQETSSLLIKNHSSSAWIRYLADWSFSGTYELYAGNEIYGSLIYKRGSLDAVIETAGGIFYIKESRSCFSKVVTLNGADTGRVKEKEGFNKSYTYTNKEGMELVFFCPSTWWRNKYHCIDERKVELFQMNCGLFKDPWSVVISDPDCGANDLLLLIFLALDLKVMKERDDHSLELT